ncbi:alkaline phosphatase family protein [Pseudoclavibacter soli]|uniref:alkaline phosphatase family protein n=1 Tax=Pseudoclavibacter soli TaxID=452623 RepID=UPI00042448B8|nr:nucleotide pyrophosphatase/phosphodiesterase family protein [Pseudoclavibacter soli]
MARSGLAALCRERDVIDFGIINHFGVVVADGLGAENLAERAGYARHLRRLDEVGVCEAAFPTTTAASLTAIATGLDPGAHGIVGYSLFDRDTGALRNQLTGWGPEMQPEVWQPAQTLFERAASAGIASFAIAPTRYRDSGFTRATLRGATVIAADSIAERFEAMSELRRRHSRTFVQIYVPELDQAGHRFGWQSARWSAALEELDAEIAAASLHQRRSATVLTADHGMLDVPRSEQILLSSWAGLSEVRAIAGEPRGVQIVLHDSKQSESAADDLAAWLAQQPGGSGIAVVTRAELVDSGWMGAQVLPVSEQRLGDVLAIGIDSRAAIPLDAAEDAPARRMIGQHGGLSQIERRVPLLLL